MNLFFEWKFSVANFILRFDLLPERFISFLFFYLVW